MKTLNPFRPWKILFGLFMAFTAASKGALAQPCNPSNGLCEPSASNCVIDPLLQSYFDTGHVQGPALKNQPSYEKRTRHPGIFSLGDGQSSYLLRSDRPSLDHEDDIREAEAILKAYQQHPEQMQGMQAPMGTAFLSPPFLVKDAGFFSQSEILITDPKDQADYESAASAIYKTLKNINRLPEEAIMASIKSAHLKLADRSIENAGVFRTRNIILKKGVPDEHIENDAILINLIKARAPKNKQRSYVRKFTKTILPKLRNEDHPRFTNEEKRILKLIMYFPPAPNEVPSAMQQFIHALKKGIEQMFTCDHFDPIGLAAYAHQKLIQIHPFMDGNKRLARLLMNGILKLAGYFPAVFPNIDEYGDAVTDNLENAGKHFTLFLRRQIQWTTQELINPCLRRFSC